MAEDFPVVDSHFHLWDPELHELGGERYWIEDFRKSHKGVNVVSAVHLQVHHDVEETDRCEAAALANDRGMPNAIVCGIDLSKDPAEVESEIEQHIDKSDKVRGVRFFPISSGKMFDYPAKADKLTDENFLKSFELLEKHNLSFDVCGFSQNCEEIAELAQKFPKTSIVCNHLIPILGVADKVDENKEPTSISAKEQSRRYVEWKEGLKKVGGQENCWLKVSGLAQSQTLAARQAIDRRRKIDDEAAGESKEERKEEVKREVPEEPAEADEQKEKDLTSHPASRGEVVSEYNPSVSHPAAVQLLSSKESDEQGEKEKEKDEEEEEEVKEDRPDWMIGGSAEGNDMYGNSFFGTIEDINDEQVKLKVLEYNDHNGVPKEIVKYINKKDGTTLTESEARVHNLAASLTPYVSHALDCFGIDRLLWGSNFPVDGFSGVVKSYKENFDSYKRCCEQLGFSDEDLRKLFYSNTLECYNLEPPAEDDGLGDQTGVERCVSSCNIL